MKHNLLIQHYLLALLIMLTAFLGACGAGNERNEQAIPVYNNAFNEYTAGRFEECVLILNEIKSYAPAQMLRAKALYFSGDEDAAQESLRRILRKNPGAQEARLFLARILRDQGNDKEAHELSMVLLRDNPEDIRALRLASNLAGERGDTDEALALLDRAIEASAETALVYADRARLRWIAGNGSGALEDLRRAELLLPWDTSLGRGIGKLRAAIKEAQQ